MASHLLIDFGQRTDDTGSTGKMCDHATATSRKRPAGTQCRRCPQQLAPENAMGIKSFSSRSSSTVSNSSRNKGCGNDDDAKSSAQPPTKRPRTGAGPEVGAAPLALFEALPPELVAIVFGNFLPAESLLRLSAVSRGIREWALSQPVMAGFLGLPARADERRFVLGDKPSERVLLIHKAKAIETFVGQLDSQLHTASQFPSTQSISALCALCRHRDRIFDLTFGTGLVRHAEMAYLAFAACNNVMGKFAAGRSVLRQAHGACSVDIGDTATFEHESMLVDAFIRHKGSITMARLLCRITARTMDFNATYPFDYFLSGFRLRLFGSSVCFANAREHYERAVGALYDLCHLHNARCGDYTALQSFTQRTLALCYFTAAVSLEGQLGLFLLFLRRFSEAAIGDGESTEAMAQLFGNLLSMRMARLATLLDPSRYGATIHDVLFVLGALARSELPFGKPGSINRACDLRVFATCVHAPDKFDCPELQACVSELLSGAALGQVATASDAGCSI
jgi:hypothetical protein